MRSTAALRDSQQASRRLTPAPALERHHPTEDLAALVREVGGDKVSVEALAKGYQDPHFVEAKPSFVLKLHSADLLVVVGRELEIGLAAAAHHAEPESRRFSPAARRTSTPR